MNESVSQLASGSRIYVDTMIFYDHLRAGSTTSDGESVAKILVSKSHHFG